ncbi:MAG: sterol desaturase family protein [Rhodospirillaceae bacterium]|nr:sterol desaturase family protein [Rhodospirillaceae bacterium]
MIDWFTLAPETESAIRMGVFLSLLVAFAAWEALAPARARTLGRILRWTGNIGVLAVGSLLARLVVPLMPVAAASLAAERGWGMFHAVDLAVWVEAVICFIALDCLIYWQHRLMHAAPLLWRLHRMHHADLEFDVTTGLRFHPFEIVLSLAIKIVAVIALGAPALAVLAFEVVLNATSMFTHINVRLPAALDQALRRHIVTPCMHRVHHSVVRAEHDSNFGFNLSWWDRLFGSYRAEAAGGADNLVIGLKDFRDPKQLRLDRMLMQPFRSRQPM